MGVTVAELTAEVSVTGVDAAESGLQSVGEAAETLNEKLATIAPVEASRIVSGTDVARAQLTLLESKVTEAREKLQTLRDSADAGEAVKGIPEAEANLTILESKAQDAREKLAQLGQQGQETAVGLEQAAVKEEEAAVATEKVATTAKHASENLSDMVKHTLQMVAAQAIFTMASDAFEFLKDKIVGCFTASMDFSNGLAQTQAVLKSTHDASGMTARGVADLADKMANLTDFNEDTTRSAENMLLTFTNIGRNIFPQATKTVLDMSQALGQDTKNSAIQLGKALNDPITGLTALQRVGVTFSETQKKLILQYMQHGQIAKAQAVILQELQREFGGSAEAAGKTFGGQLQILGHRFEEVQRAIGNALMPTLKAFVSWVTANVMPAIEQMGKWFQSTGGPAIQRFGAFLTSTVIPAIVSFSRNSQVMTPILAGIAATLVAALIPAVWSLAAGMIAATWPFLAIGAAVAGLVAIFQHFYTSNAGFKQFIDSLVVSLRQAWSVLQANFVPALQQAGNFIRANVVPALQQTGTFLRTVVLPALQQVGAFLVATFKPVWQQLVQVWQTQLLPSFHQIQAALVPLMPLFQFLAQVVGVVLVFAFGVLIGIIKGVIQALAGIISGLATAVAGIVQWGTGIVQYVSGIVQFIADLFTGHFSKLGADLGLIWQGIVNMFQGAGRAILGLFQALWSGSVGLVQGMVNGIISVFEHLFGVLVGHSIVPDMINAIVAAFTSLVARGVSAVQGLASGLMGFFSNLAAQAVAWGSNVIQGIVNGIMSMAGAVANAIGNIAGIIADHLPHSPAKAGPLMHLDEWMPSMGQYLATGIKAQAPKIRSAALEVAHSIAVLAPSPELSGVVPPSFSASVTGPTIVVQAPPIYLDGRLLSNGLMPHIVNNIRYGVGVRS